MKRASLALLLVVLILGGAALFSQYWLSQPEQRQETPSLQTEIPVAEEEPPKILHPIPVTPPPEAIAPAAPRLPKLNESDAHVHEALAALAGDQPLEELFFLREIIRRAVITIDNLPRTHLPQKYLSTRPVAGEFLVRGEDDAVVIDPENARRYTPYIKLAEAVDTQALVSLYVRLYPLFQEAYEDLGYPSAYFNDRLVEVIDHLLAAPEIRGEIRLSQPHVLYQFADPELESSSAGHKMLIRIGYDNQLRVKARLRALRQALVKLGHGE